MTKHRTPWDDHRRCPHRVRRRRGKRYDGASDWTQANDLAMQQPDKLPELQRLFIIEATRYNVLPLDDRSFERALPEIVEPS